MNNASVDVNRMRSFAQFYPYYLGEHGNRSCRRLHFVGSTLSLLCVVLALWQANGWFVLLGLMLGYGFAWAGHFGFEKNKPASFSRPLYSFMGDWVMYKDMWTGKIPF